MKEVVSGTRSVDSLSEWATALGEMYSSDTKVPRILWVDMYKQEECLDITEAVTSSDFPGAEHLTGGTLLPVIRVGEAALRKWVVLPPVVCDMMRISGDFIDQLEGGTSDGHKFTGFSARLGSMNFGWHIDGAKGPPHVNHLTTHGAREASFVKIGDEARIKTLIAKQVKPSQAEINGAEQLQLNAATSVTFSPNYRKDLGIMPDLHWFRNAPNSNGGVSYLLKQHELNDRALAILEQLACQLPALGVYHPDEVSARVRGLLPR